MLGACSLAGLAFLGGSSVEWKSFSGSPTVQEILGQNSPGGLSVEQWRFLPGAKQQGDALRIMPQHFVLAEQDGSVAQANAPINLYGQRLQVTGDFAVHASMREMQGPASMRLYGEVPIIADEFRIEGKSIQASINGRELRVLLWDGEAQQPQEYIFGLAVEAENRKLTIARHGEQIAFFLDGYEVGSVDAPDLFTDGTVWFGFEAGDEPWVLSDLETQALPGGSVEVVDVSQLPPEAKDPQGLQTLAMAKRPDFIIGGALAIGPATADAELRRVALGGNLGSITPENEMKMMNTQPTEDVFDFTKADALVDLAQKNGVKVHGHTLVFGEALPPWFSALPVETAEDKERIKTIMLQRVTTMAEHYRGRVVSWDVINEPMASYDDTADGEGAELRNHAFFKAMGEAYMLEALVAAHQADPNATLCINEYGLEADGLRWDAFYATIQRLAPQLEERGVPLDKLCVGFQSHVYEPGDRIDPAILNGHINQLGDLRISSRVSEMDVYGYQGDDEQTDQFGEIFEVCFANQNCMGWGFWIWDRYNYWRDDNGQIQTGVDGLWGNNMQPRPAVDRIREIISKQ
jgi:endo-1,4-beta-xylanase